jgi:hypothetical protein
MIHTLRGEPRRRIAVIQIPRGQRSRLGIIRSENWVAGPNTTGLNSLVPLSDLTTTLMANGSSTTPEEWMAVILQRQAQAQLQTPGTLNYTAAPSPPSGATIEAPWASWQTADCNPDAGSLSSIGAQSPAAAAAAGQSDNTWYLIAAAIGAVASLVYLQKSANRRAS